MHALVLGAGGQLARDLEAVFQREGGVSSYSETDVDITDEEAVWDAVRESEPDVVLNAAAYTNVEKAEEDSDTAFRVNEYGARCVARVSAEMDIPVVYYSTDYVFSGQKGAPYEVDDRIAPAGVYARSKAAGEAATRSTNARHYIVRTAWLYGPGPSNFVEKILKAATTRPELRVVTDEIGSPTYTWDLAEATLALCQCGRFGLYHCVNAGACTRFEFAQAILREAGLSTPVAPCTSAEFPMKAPRPSYSVLSNAALEAACGFTMPAWQDALARFIKRRQASA